ncbi:MAG: dioxygenase [Myxococcales bacterium]|nr:dioxygenase [Myxococcales bacterium]
MTSDVRMPTVFVPHGGGPWPVLPLRGIDAGETEALHAFMASIAEVPPRRPSALVVISAHWEAPTFAVNRGEAPPMLFDYGGFPEEAYRFEWPAPGDPELAARVYGLLGEANLDPAYEDTRGFDHGTFIPLMVAYPKADVPVVQVSLKAGLDPEEHLRLGEALAPLRDEGVFIVGSGNSYHNLPRFFSPTAEAVAHSRAFDEWLADVVAAPAKDRGGLLRRWRDAPSGEACHPREEHLIPLMVVAGAAGPDQGRVGWSGSCNGLRLSAHYFG